MNHNHISNLCRNIDTYQNVDALLLDQTSYPLQSLFSTQNTYALYDSASPRHLQGSCQSGLH